uniref:response regulator n=1 Tax=Agathobacter sp. TaxID=2021311 RepID=UPI00405737FE
MSGGNLLKEKVPHFPAGLLPEFTQYAELIPGGFFVYLEEEPMEMLYVNQRTLDIFGYENLEEFKTLTGYTFRGLVHPDDFCKIQASIDEQIANVENKDLDYVEYRIIRKDGSVRWVDDYGHLARSKEYGNLYYVFISDITEKKQAMEAVRELEKEKQQQTLMLYEAMLEQFNALADESLTVIRSNLTTGIIEDVRGKDVYDVDYAGGSIQESKRIRENSFCIEGDKERYQKIFQIDKLLKRNNSKDGPAAFVGYCRRASGRQCFVKFSGTASINPITGDTIVFGVETEYNIEMVTDAMNSKILAKQYDMVSYIVDNYYEVVIGDAASVSHGNIFPKTRNGTYTDYIKEQVLPVAAEEYDREELLKALSPETIAERLKEQEPYTVDIICQINEKIYNKRFMYYEVDRKSKFYICLKSDITDVLKAEKLRNEQLKNALKEANQANIAKTTFLSSMSHEIRTPMNAIIGLDSIALKDSTISPNTRMYLEKIGNSARHLLGLINDILDMSRIESGRMVMKNSEFSFGNMLEQINTMINSQCQDKGLYYESTLHGEIRNYYIGDEIKLKQVLINILGNAVKFTPPQGTVSFATECISQYGNMSTFRFVIKDTGIGMDKEYIPKLFEVFSQEDATTANQYGGSGLGMSITKNIVEMMQGNISVQSEKGVGTEFTVVITLKNSNRINEDEEPLPLQELKALIVDDELLACEYAKIELDKMGIVSDTCLSGEQALHQMELKAARQEPYNLILLDLKMPKQDGIEVTRQIRRKYGDGIMVFILTANGLDGVLEEAIEVGIDGFLEKPLLASVAMSEFRKVMRQKTYQNHEDIQNLEGKRILVAEDISINMEIMMELLEMKGVEAKGAENGRKAVELFAKSSLNYYDAILMDVRMPVMNGLEAAAKIREMDRDDAKTIPIIAMTANAFDEDVQRSLQAGMNAHLTKPVEMGRLYETLEGLIMASCKKHREEH